MGIMPFDFNQITAATGFDYPDGDYIFEIEKTEERVSQDGQQRRLLVGNKILMGPWASEEYKGRKLSHSYQYSQKGAQFIKRLLHSCGYTDEVIRQNGGKMDHSWLIGRQFVASVSKNGQYTNVNNERPVSEWDPSKAPSATTTAGVPVSAPPPSIMQPVQTAQPQMPTAPQVQAPVTGAPFVQAPPVATMVPPAMQTAAPPVQPPVAQAAPAQPAVQPVAQPVAPQMAAPPIMAAPPPVVAAPPVAAAQPIAAAPQPPQATAGPVGIPAPAPPPGTPVQ